MDKATGMTKDQKTDKRAPTTAVVAGRPLSESQWVCCRIPFLVIRFFWAKTDKRNNT